MKNLILSEKYLIEEITKKALLLKKSTRNLSIGEMIKIIRTQLKMTQRILSKRAKVPQSTICRIENNSTSFTIDTLNKILSALFCDMLIVPILKDKKEKILDRQAEIKAKEHINYLKGTMSLEKQAFDSKFTKLLIKEEKADILKSDNVKLWED